MSSARLVAQSDLAHDPQVDKTPVDHARSTVGHEVFSVPALPDEKTGIVRIGKAFMVKITPVNAKLDVAKRTELIQRRLDRIMLAPHVAPKDIRVAKGGNGEIYVSASHKVLEHEPILMVNAEMAAMNNYANPQLFASYVATQIRGLIHNPLNMSIQMIVSMEDLGIGRFINISLEMLDQGPDDTYKSEQEWCDEGITIYRKSKTEANAPDRSARLDEAGNAFRHAIKKAPGYVEPYLWLAGIYIEQGKSEQAHKTLAMLQRTEPKKFWNWQKRRFDKLSRKARTMAANRKALPTETVAR